jgi:hypothetical protein
MSRLSTRGKMSQDVYQSQDEPGCLHKMARASALHPTEIEFGLAAADVTLAKIAGLQLVNEARPLLLIVTLAVFIQASEQALA